jgi:hypothetical protein
MASFSLIGSPPTKLPGAHNSSWADSNFFQPGGGAKVGRGRGVGVSVSVGANVAEGSGVFVGEGTRVGVKVGRAVGVVVGSAVGAMVGKGVGWLNKGAPAVPQPISQVLPTTRVSRAITRFLI